MRRLKVVIEEDGSMAAKVDVTLVSLTPRQEQWHARVVVDKGPSVGHYAFMVQVERGFNSLGLLGAVLESMNPDMITLEGDVVDGDIATEAGPPALGR